MNQSSAIDVLAEALTAVPQYDNPLDPIYEALWHAERPLTLYAIWQHTQLLHTYAAQAQEQAFAVNQVIHACKRIPPIPLSTLPLGF